MNKELSQRFYVSERKLLGENGELKIVGLDLNYIKNKKILDVGIGGGEALIEAARLGLNYHGIDILPLIDPQKVGINEIAIKNTEEKKKKLMRTALQYPEMFTAADAAKKIPFEDDEFQVTFSSLGLPEYARSPHEVINSIIEMCRVTRGLVAFPVAWDPNKNFPQSRSIADFGDSANYFQFMFRNFLKELSTAGIESRRFRKKMDSGIHLNTENKDNSKLEIVRRLFIPIADKFLVYPENPKE